MFVLPSSIHIVVEAVVLRWGDGIELIYLHKCQLRQLWLLLGWRVSDLGHG